MRVLLPDLLPDTDYSVQVRVNDGTNVSEWSNVFDFHTIDDTSDPDNPGGVIWISVGDAFYGEWDAVLYTTDGKPVHVQRYDVELTAGTMTRVVAVPHTDADRVSFTLSFEQNKALFINPQPEIGFRVRAIGMGNRVSAWYPLTPIVAQNPVPNPPTDAVVVNGENFIGISWTAPTGATDDDLIGYNVYAGTTAGFTPVAGNLVWSGDSTNFTYSTLTFTTIYFKIRSVDKFNQESTDLTAEGLAESPWQPDTVAPGIPTGLAGTITNDEQGFGATMAVSWTMASPPSDMAGFYVRFRKVGTTLWNYVSFDRDARDGTLLLSEAYVDYEIQISAYDWQNNYSGWSAVVTVSGIDNTPPANVTGLAGTAGKDSITYTWDAVADKDLRTYEVTVSTSSTFASGNVTFYSGTSTTLNVGGLTTGTTYYARVRAVDRGGLTSAAWSSTLSKTTGNYPTVNPTDGVVPAVPGTPSATGGLSYLYVTWPPVTTNALGAASTDIVTYEVHLSTTTGFTPSGSTKVTEVSGTSSIIDNLPGTMTPLSYGTDYYIKIIAKDGDGTQTTPSAQAGPVQISKVATGDVQSIGADLIIPGTGIAANLQISSGGSIRSANYDPVTAHTGYKIDNTGIDVQSGSIKASALIGDTLGSSTGTINIGLGAAIQTNGGPIKSNTFNGTFDGSGVYQNNATAGFYLSDSYFIVPQGKISANALNVGGTISSGNIVLGGPNNTTGTIQTSGYNGTSGFRLSSQGLEIPNGSLLVSKLSTQIGHNVMPFEQTTFEYPSNFYAGRTSLLSGGTTPGYSTTNALWSVNTTSPASGKQCLTLTRNGGAGNMVGYLAHGTTGTEALIPVESGQPYILSGYFRDPIATAVNAALGIMWFDENGSQISSSLSSFTSLTTSATAFQRLSNVVTAPSTAVRAIVYVESQTTTSGARFDIDEFQLELQTSPTVTAPSSWKPGGNTTRIDGGQIITGSIHSLAYAKRYDASGNASTDSTKWAWEIETDGDATFGNVQIEGSLLVGAGGGTSVIQSYGFIGAGTAGYQLKSDGTALFNNIKLQSVSATTNARIELRTSTDDSSLRPLGMYMYNASNVQTFSADASTGNLKLSGSVTSGGALTVGSAGSNYIKFRDDGSAGIIEFYASGVSVPGSIDPGYNVTEDMGTIDFTPPGYVSGDAYLQIRKNAVEIFNKKLVVGGDVILNSGAVYPQAQRMTIRSGNSQNLPSGTWSVVTWANSVASAGSGDFLSYSGGIFDMSGSGSTNVYLVIASVSFAADANNRRQLEIRSGSTHAGATLYANAVVPSAGAGDDTAMTVSAIVDNSTAYNFGIWAFQNSGNTLAITPHRVAVWRLR